MAQNERHEHKVHLHKVHLHKVHRHDNFDPYQKDPQAPRVQESGGCGCH